MSTGVTRQEFLRGAGRLAAAVAAGSALASVAETGALAEDDEETSPLSPRPGATRICADTPLAITFASPPTIGTTGLIRVFQADATLVDTIDLSAATQTKTVGLNPLPYNYHPVIVSGNTASIYLHQKLSYNQTYYVLVDAGALSTATGPFNGITDPHAWRFTTKATGPTLGRTLRVDASGHGDFCTIQGAIDLVPANNTSKVRIELESGTYTEILYIAATQPFIEIEGDNRDHTIIQYANNNAFNGSNRALFNMQASDFSLRNVTVHNTTPEGGTQAEALRGSGLRMFIDHCAFKSRQDTVWLQGSVYVHDCYIEGDVDFMWGYGTCFFDRCEIVALHRTVSSSPGYYTQIRNPINGNGNVYHRCRLATDPGWVAGDTLFYLGRIDPTVFPYSQVAYIDCAMCPEVEPAGWLLNHATTAPYVQFWEYGSTDLNGKPLDVSQRAPFSRQLTKPEATLWSDPTYVLGWTPPEVERPEQSEPDRLAAAILAQSKAPKIPERTFKITDYGAVADGVTDTLPAINAALAACKAAGGGTVVVPSGTYFVSGSIWITGNNMGLHLAKNATLKFDFASQTNLIPKGYPLLDGTGGKPKLSGGSEMMSLVFATDVTNLAITGEGATSVIDGQAVAGRYTWWSWAGKTQYGWVAGDPIESTNGWPKRPRGVQPYNCTNVLLKNFKTVNMPQFQFRPALCTNVIAEGVMPMSGAGPNNDGIDPASCVNFVIRRCTIDAGDDAVALGAFTSGGALQPNLNTLIEDCDIYRGHGGVAIGSGATGGVANVVARRLRMHDPRLQFGLRIKLNPSSGGIVQNIYFSDVESVGLSNTGVLVDYHYNDVTTGPLTPFVRHVQVRNFRVGAGVTSLFGLYLYGLSSSDPVQDVSLTNVNLTSATTPEVENHVTGLALTNVTINGQPVTS